MATRLATGIWVSALLHRLDADAVGAYVVRRGDDTAGSVLLIHDRRDGSAALWVREYDMDTDAQVWRITQEGPRAEIEAAAARQRSFDPDLWLIEVEADPSAYLI
ncbi:MAG: DUF1491 family protein [Paracoccus sp. (in: a-proteobacteria)]|uniref:DUF1491 family protein n=1 Tax=Paracoccus sp. TaxID=267 RepID=UPI0026E095D6|nr:DUF1491 family protein [Paracoccus sp. (in: a-proteobacteria)]MDO5620051.1 DUF1491 family protein [Paracoccus sp. (in: a-proteobacteria)]